MSRGKEEAFRNFNDSRQREMVRQVHHMEVAITSFILNKRSKHPDQYIL